MTFDAAKHPRGHHTNPGRFSEKAHSAPEAELGVVVATSRHLELDDRSDLTGVYAKVVLEPGESDTFDTGDDGGPIERVHIARSEDGSAYTLTGEADLNYAWLAPEQLSEQQKDQWVRDNRALIDHFLYQRYGVDVDHDTGDDRETLAHVTATIEQAGDAPTVTQAMNRLWDETDLVKVYNESDEGTTGSENMTRLYREFAADYSLVPYFYSARDAAAYRTWEDVNWEVHQRLGKQEISDSAAVRIARDLADGHDGTPELRRLATQGFADREAVHKELAAIYAGPLPSPIRGQIDMMHTWLIHGADKPSAIPA